jgi:hypothetical protein
MFKRIFPFALFLAMIASAAAQPAGRSAAGNDADTVRDFSSGAMLNIVVSIKGNVATPGRYQVASTTKLAQLLAYAGGPMTGARLDGVRILHDLTIDSTADRGVTLFDMEKYRISGDQNQNPILIHGDTIVVPGESDGDSVAPRATPAK